MKSAKSKVKPCPCCGNAKLYVGVMSSTTWGVQCGYYFNKQFVGCGLNITTDMFTMSGNLPKGCKNFKDAEKFALKLSIKNWNKRA